MLKFFFYCLIIISLQFPSALAGNRFERFSIEGESQIKRARSLLRRILPIAKLQIKKLERDNFMEYQNPTSGLSV